MKRLPTEKYGLVREALENVPVNTLFARFVADEMIDGPIYTDDPDDPKAFYIVHPYGMTLLLGDSTDESFQKSFQQYVFEYPEARPHFEWMQAYPPAWHQVLEKLFEGRIVKVANNIDLEEDIVELHNRANFAFDPEQFAVYKQTVYKPDPRVKVVRTDRDIFEKMPGDVIPSCFWDSAEDFFQNGFGFSALYDGELAATAYLAYTDRRDRMELGIETVGKFRGEGMAQHACTAYIEYCLENDWEPVWSCRFENSTSYRLAQKLGFAPTRIYPYYRIPK